MIKTMKKHEYIAKRPFAAFEPGDRLVQQGEKVSIKNKSTANDMIKKGLIYPKYDTKEDKEAMKVQKPTEKARIEHDAGPCFYIMQGDTVIDRECGGKKKAQKRADEINAKL